MARPLDFAVPLKKGRPLPLLVDAEEVSRSRCDQRSEMPAVSFTSNEGLGTTSREIRGNLANAK
jgi:hypothetical protein